MPFEFKTRRRVEFADTDMAGIVHFSNYFRYMEAAEHAFFRSLGILLHRQSEGDMRGFARVHASCDYTSPLRCYDEVELHLLVERVGDTSIAYRFLFTRTEDRGRPCPPERVATGALTVVSIGRAPDGRLRRRPLDPEIARAIEPAPAHLLQENA